MTTNCDGFDPNPPESGYCEHGTYTGGCGYDLMCGWCEDGISADEVAAIQASYVTRHAQQLIEIFDNLVAIAQRSPRGWIPGIAQYLMDEADSDRYNAARRHLATT